MRIYGGLTRGGRAFAKLAGFAVAMFVSLAAAPALADLGVSMSVDEPTYQNPIIPGQVTALRITVTNSNAGAPIANTAFTFNLNSNVRVANNTPVTYSCTSGDGVTVAPTGAITAALNSSQISLSGGAIPVASGGGSSGRCVISVEVTSTTAGSHVNTLPIGAVTGDDGAPVSNGSAAAQSITVTALNAPTITKSFSTDDPIVAGDQTVRLTITVSNASNATADLPLNGLGDSPSFGLRDVLPSPLRVASTPNASFSCSGSTFAPTAGDTQLQVIGGTVAAGGSCTFAVDLVADTNSQYETAVTNTINASSDFANKRGLAALANATDTLTIRSVLRVEKQFARTTVAASQASSFELRLINASPTRTLTLNNFSDTPIDGVGNAAYGLKVSGALSFSNCGAGAAGAANGTNTGVDISGVQIAPGATCRVTVPFVGTLQNPGTPQAFTNTLAQGAITVSSDASVISRGVSASVTLIDLLTVSKTSSPAQASAGSPVKYTISVSNYVNGPVDNVTITDVLPTGMTALSTSPEPPQLVSGPCTDFAFDFSTSSTAVLRVDMPAAVNGSPQTCVVSFWAMVPAGASGNLVNTIPAGAIQGNGPGGVVTNPGGSTGSASFSIIDALTVGKVFNPASAFEGAISEVTVTFTNTTSSVITNASFTDNLPIGSTGLQMVVASPANASTTCAGTPVITATPGANSVTLTGASIPARASNGTGAFGACTLRFSVIAGAGSYNNTLAAAALSGTQTKPDTSTATISSPGPIVATMNYDPALTAGKSFSPTVISSGGVSTVRVQLGNVGDSTLTNVSVIDPLPTGMTVAPTPNAYSTCGGSPSITAAAGASSVQMTGAVIPSGGQCALLFDVRGTGGSNWTNTVPAGNISAAGGIKNVTPITATLTNNTTGGVTVTNNTNPNSLTSPGQTAVLTVTLTNDGTIPLTNLGLVNYFTNNGTSGGAPTGMVVASQPNAQTTCAGGTVGASADGAQVTLSGASLGAGLSCQVLVNVTMRQTGTIQNTIPVGAVTNSQGITNALATVTSLSADAQLGVIKTFLPPVVKPGERSRLRLTLINPVALAVSNISLTDNLPAGVVVPAGANPTTNCTDGAISAPSAGQVIITGARLSPASGGVSTICVSEIDVLVAAAGSYLNTIPAGGVTGQIGASPVQNPNPATANVQARMPVTIGKVIAPATVNLGQPATVTLTLNNPNAVALTAAALTDSLPSNLTVALTPNASTTCAGSVVTAPSSATSVQLAGGTIPANGSCTVTFNVVSNVGGVYENTIPAGGLATSQGVTNETPATDDLRVIVPPPVSKQFAPASIPANGTSVLTIVLGNQNAGTATLTSPLVDTLPTAPGPIVVAATPNVTGTCTLASVTALPGDGTITYATGATVPPGGCTISVNVTGAVEGAHTNLIPVGGLKTSLGDNVLPASADLTISPLGYISGRVFKDNNLSPNGTFEVATDSPISGVTIELAGTDYGADGAPGGAADAPVSRTTTTDALGNYAFFGLNPGAYTVSEPTQPAGTNNGLTTAGAVTGGGGGTAGAATAISATPSAISNIILLKDGASRVAGSPGNDFAEIAPASIAGVVFLDQDDNGVRNAADTALSGVTLQLLNASNAIVATTTSDASGAYSFTGLAPGTYSVREPTQPAGTASGKTIPGTVSNGGTAGVGTAQNVVPSVIAGIVLPPGTNATANNFAEVPAGRQIAGRVFIDSNNDGLFNGSDTGLASVPLTLTGTDFNGLPVTATVSTTSDGRYVFTGLAAGNYNVTEPNQPSGTLNGITTAGTTGGLATLPAVVPSVISGIDLTGTNSISNSNDFGEVPRPADPIPTVSVRGRVYVDADNDGVPDAGEGGIGGVTLLLTGVAVDNSNVSLTTVTGADGAYIFPLVPSSSAAGYTITEVQPSEYVDGKTTINGASPGTPAATKPVAAGGQDIISGVVVGSSSLASYDFGERPVGVAPKKSSVAGYVYADANNNGLRDNGEAGIGDVSVLLEGVDNAGAPVYLTTKTSANGAFLFDNVPESSAAGYQLTEIQPAGYNDGKSTVAAGNPGVTASSKPVKVGDFDVVSGVVVPTGATLVDYAFGEVPIPQLKPPIISGYVWMDRKHTRVRPRDGAMTGQPGWTVVLRQNGQHICTTKTVADGFYQFDNLHCAGYELSGLPTGSGFSITFDKDGNNMPAVPTSGDNRGEVPPTGGQILNITLNPADRVVEQNLPLDPAGVVYDSVTRQPVPGANVVFSGPAGYDPTRHLVGSTAAASQTVGEDGLYQFWLQNDFPSGVYTLTVTAPAGYQPAPSTSLPPCVGVLSVGLNPNPALVQASDFAPGQSVAPQLDPNSCPGLVPGGSSTTQYYFNFFITNGGSAPILNNHIPLDPILSGALFVTKTTPKISVGRGELVPYTITATNTSTSGSLNNVRVRDQLPPGFKYRSGTATRNGQKGEPVVEGGFVTWPADNFAAQEKKTYTLMLTVGAGVGDGDYVNRAWAAGASGDPVSNTGSATVRITPDPTFDCPDIIGKVFDDKNANGYQDEGEPGIPGVRMAPPNGLLVTSDAEGRFHVPCPAVPNADRGSNFVLKLDERTLPSGFRLTTENPRDVRITRGKMVKLNFGATIHRVVRLELADAAFQAGAIELLSNWRSRVDGLNATLKEAPSIVRIAYRAGDDPPDLVRKRVEHVRAQIQRAWKNDKGQYALVIEIEGER